MHSTMVPMKCLIPIFVSLVIVVVGHLQMVSALSCVSRYSPKIPGSCIEPSQCTGAALPGICTNSPSKVCCLPSLHNTGLIKVKNVLVSRATFYKMVGETRRTTSLYPYYIKALDDAGISTPEQIAAFTAQIFYQTSNFTLTEEDTDGLQYENSTSLGNNQPGDGPRYRGRGFLPITGRHMYKVLAESINQDLEDAPESAAMPALAFEIAVWLWKNGYQSDNRSSRNTGPLKNYARNTKYGFVMMSYAMPQDNDAVASVKQFPSWLSMILILNATCPSEGEGPKCTAGEHEGVCKLSSGCKGKSVEKLCDGPADIKCCVECNNPIDLVFVVDGSGSVGRRNFKLMMDFVSNVSKRFGISSSNDGTQVALIRYSSTSKVIFNFKECKSHASLKQALSEVRFIGGGTNTVLALETALDLLLKDPASGVRPKSSGASRILILLTDGKTNVKLHVIQKPADALRREGVEIFTVGIGETVKVSELQVIASDPDKDHMFLSESFEGLREIVSELQTASCNEPALLESGTDIDIDIQQKEKKFFRYENFQLEELVLLLVNQTAGDIEVHPSLTKKNPIKETFASCDSDVFITGKAELEAFVNETFCSLNPEGGIAIPAEHEKNNQGNLKAAFVKMCSRNNLYVGAEGLHGINSFVISLLNLSNSSINTKELFASVMESDFPSKNASTPPTFPLQRSVYIGCTVAASGAMATVVAYLALSFAGKSTEVLTKGSSKMKVKKKTGKEKGDSSDSDSEEDKTQNIVMISSAQLRFQGLIRHVLLILSVINAMKPRPKGTEQNKNEGMTSDRSDKQDSRGQVLEKSREEIESVKIEKESCAASIYSKKTELKSELEKTKETFQKGIHLDFGSLRERKAKSDNDNNEILTGVVGGSLRGTSVFNEKITKNILNGKRESGKTINDLENVYGKLGTVMFNSNKSKILSKVCPCFTALGIHDGGEQGASETRRTREKRFENDMHISQALCVLATQAIFMVSIKARENEIHCAAAAIAMNYLYLAAMVWLSVEACHLYRVTVDKKAKNKAASDKGKFYVLAWGFPLVVVPVMMIKPKRYTTNPHCWISMTNILDLAASAPFFTVGLIQLVIFGLLFKVLCTYRNKTNNKEKETKKEKLKSGLMSNLCITLVVLASWCMATVSVNIYNHLYQTAFAACNSLQGAALVLFYVVLSKETRQASSKMISKMACSKRSAVAKFNELNLVQIPQPKDNDSRNVKSDRITSLRNSMNKGPEKTTSFNRSIHEDPELITSLDNPVRKDSADVPRTSKENMTASGWHDERLAADNFGIPSSLAEKERNIKAGVRKVHDRIASLTPAGLLDEQSKKPGEHVTQKISEAKNFLKRKGKSAETWNKRLRTGSQKLTNLFEQF